MPKKPLSKRSLPTPEQRNALLIEQRERKMARSPHAYVRGATGKFYEWLDAADGASLPDGPHIWICGDCHTGNLGPVADGQGNVDIQIRDLDQTVIGHPVHDLIRLGLSLTSAARGSALPGVITVKMIEALCDGYRSALVPSKPVKLRLPAPIRMVMKEAVRRSWQNLARERIDDLTPTLPLGKRFWPLKATEKSQLQAMFEKRTVAALATQLRGRPDTGNVSLLDAAYWVKGCSSLGRLRYAVLLDVDGGAIEGDDLCLMDVKEGVKAAAPSAAGAVMPRDNARRVIEGARNLSPYLGERMRAARLQDRAVIVRELLPQDLKFDIDQLSEDDAMHVAYHLASVVGRAHARQMDSATQKRWHAEMARNTSKRFAAPTWLWTSIVDLLASHETAYLEHCRRLAAKQVY